MAREALGRQAWEAARAAYASAQAPLPLVDLEPYAIAAHLTGRETECRETLVRAYREAVRLEDVTRAVRFAFFLGHSMIFTGEMGQANGWFARARSLLSERAVDCVEWGYLLVPTGVEQIAAGDARGACNTFAGHRRLENVSPTPRSARWPGMAAAGL